MLKIEIFYKDKPDPETHYSQEDRFMYHQLETIIKLLAVEKIVLSKGEFKDV